MPSKPARKTAQPKARDKALAKALKTHLKAAILPGDTPLEGALLGETAQFVLDTAREREALRSALRLETAKGERRLLRIAIINDDMPFLVDSIAATIAAQGLSIDRLVHPVLMVERNEDGELVEMAKASSSDETRESIIYIETPRVDARQRRELEKALRVTLGDVRAAVNDWKPMQAAMAADAARIVDEESRALLGWLNSGLLTQLGYLKRTRDGTQSDLRGICRMSTRELLAEASFDRAFAWFDRGDAKGETRELLVIKANRLSYVHRRVPLDLFITGLRDENGGKVEALSIHAGIWTTSDFNGTSNTFHAVSVVC